jgi:hypothetical protein
VPEIAIERLSRGFSEQVGLGVKQVKGKYSLGILFCDHDLVT